MKIDPNTQKSYVKKMKTTSYARYDAHKRCKRLNNTSLFALTSASLLLITLGILRALAGDTNNFIADTTLDVFSLIASLIILVLSLVVSFASFDLMSERYFRAANEINDLCDNLEVLSEQDTEVVKEIMERYFEIRKHTDNHQGYNYKRGRLERKTEAKDKIEPEDKLTFVEHVGYWAPIFSFYLISITSLCVFSYAIMKFFCHA